MEQENLEPKKKEEFPPSWWSFLFFSALAVFTVLFSEGWLVPFGGVMFGVFAILSWPNKNGHFWIMKQVSNLGKLTGSLLKYSFYFVLFFVGLWFGGKIFEGIGGFGKYEGMTASEWYYEYVDAKGKYNDLHSCIEDYVYSEEYSALEDIQFNCL